MSSPYKRMFVLNEDEYKEYKRFKASQVPIDESVIPTVKCPKCGRGFPNENILAHHLKSHFDGFRCNICNKVFKTKPSLTTHLQQHAPQVEPSKHSVLDSHMPNQPMSQPSLPLPQSSLSIPKAKPPKRKPHKHKSVINFTAKKWLTLQ